MKIRKGFVSNSSSSSFVISGNIETGKMVVSIDLSKFGTLIKTKEQLKEYYEQEWGEYNEDEKVVDKQLRILESGQSLFLGSLDNEMISVLDYLDGDFKVNYDY